MLCPCQLLNTADQGRPWHSGKLEWGPPERSALAPPRPHAQSLGSFRREEVCVSPVSVGRTWLPRCHRQQGPGPGAALCVYVGGRAASVLCVTLPSRGPVPSVPREPQPKLQGDGGEGGQMALTEWAAPSPAGSFLANWKARIASLTPPTAGSLSASPMPYAWAHCHRICNTCG